MPRIGFTPEEGDSNNPDIVPLHVDQPVWSPTYEDDEDEY